MVEPQHMGLRESTIQCIIRSKVSSENSCLFFYPVVQVWSCWESTASAKLAEHRFAGIGNTYFPEMGGGVVR